MAQLNIEVPHELEQAEAFKRIKGISSLLKEHYAGKISNLNERWENNYGKLDFNVMGYAVSLNIDITKRSVKLSADLPFAASFFKSRIENTVKGKLIALLRSDSSYNEIVVRNVTQTGEIKTSFADVAFTVIAALIAMEIIMEIFCEKKISRSKVRDAARVLYRI